MRAVIYLCAIALCCVACGRESPHCPRVETASAASTAAAAATDAPPTRVNILIDGSGSMAGYFSTAEAGNHYRDLLRQLRSDLRDLWGDSLEVSFSRFGRKVALLAPEDEAQMTRREFYTRHCPAMQRGGCDVDASSIGLALQQAEARPHSELTVVFTDLFLTDDEKLEGGVRSLEDPLYRVLSHKGRAVALLGIETPFQGTIYELPDQPTYLHQPRAGTPMTTRPVFAVMVGRSRHILALYRALHGPLLADLGTHQKFAFYSADWDSVPQNVSWAMSRGVRADELRGEPGRTAYRVRANSYEPMTAELTDETFKTRYGLSFDHFVTRESLWTERGKPGCVSREQFSGVSPLSAAQATAAAVRVSLFSDPQQVRHLPAPNLYALDVDVVASSVRPGQSASLDEWNLDPGDVPRLLHSHPAFFPALNLKAVTRFLEARTRDNFEPVVVAHTTVMFRVEK